MTNKTYKTENTDSGSIIYDFSEGAPETDDPRSTIRDPDTGEVFYIEESIDSATLS